MHHGGQRMRSLTSLQNSPNDTVAGSSSGCGTLVLMIQCRYPGEVLKYATEQRRFVPRADSLKLSQADVRSDTVWVLWDVHTPRGRVVFEREFKEHRTRFWLLLHQQLAASEEKGRQKCGRLSMILSMSSCGSDSSGKNCGGQTLATGSAISTTAHVKVRRRAFGRDGVYTLSSRRPTCTTSEKSPRRQRHR